MYDVTVIIFLIFAGQTAGSLLGLLKKPSDRLLYASLAFAGSMMLSISFLELLPQSLGFAPPLWVVASFFLGLVCFKLLDRFLPHIHPELLKKEGRCVKRTVNMLVIGIALHNIPEGLAVGMSFAIDPTMGLLIAIAISIQDIPENLATIVPLYCLNRNRGKSFGLLMITVLFELGGFLLGFYALHGVETAFVGAALAMASGFMVYISLDELIPSAKLKEYPKQSIIAMILGFAVTLGFAMISALGILT